MQARLIDEPPRLRPGRVRGARRKEEQRQNRTPHTPGGVSMRMAIERKVGPRERCPACGSKNVSKPAYCAPGNRAMIGLLKWCEKDGKHLHQKCSCGCRWECTPTEIKT
jgi:hypothetical protein